jgi:DNA-binding MarR family transcriptional regulator
MYDAALAPSGLRSTQFAILVEVDNRGAPPTIGDLAQALVMDASTIGQNLLPLEREGLLKTQRAKADRRRKCVALTRKGRARLEAALPLWLAAQRRFEGKFGAQAAMDLRQTLAAIAREPAFVG